MQRTPRIFLIVVFTLFSSSVTFAQATETFGGHAVAAREVLVSFRAVNQQALGQLMQAHDIVTTQAVGRSGVMLVRSRSQSVDMLIQALSNRPDVIYAEPNYILRAIRLPNDTFFNVLWGLRNTGQTILGVPGTPGADIGAEQAWDVTTGTRGQVVGVVDTGVDYNHPDLAANMWSAPAAFTVQIGSNMITCPAGSRGFNAIVNSCNPADDNGHGTHVAGTIGAAGNNGVGVTGVNWVASIMALKFLDSTGSGSTVDAIEAIDFAIQAKARFGSAANVRVLNNSWGGGGFSISLQNQIALAANNDILFVAAAGNDGFNNDVFPHYPSSYNVANVVAVASTANRDDLSVFSNVGATSVDLGAPGEDIGSTIPGGYAYSSGTSMATPHVAGAAALLLSACSLTTSQLKSTLLNNVDPAASLAGRTVTGGRLNVDRAIRTCSGPQNPDFTLTPTPASRTVAPGGSASFTISVAPIDGFNGNVQLSISGLPSGAFEVINPNPVSGAASATLTINTSTSVQPGTYALTITGTSGALVHNASVTLSVAVPADFTISATPASQIVTPGGRVMFGVSVTGLNGFNGTVTLTQSGRPPRSDTDFAPKTITGTGASIMTFYPGTSAFGTYTITIRGTSGSTVRTTSVQVVVSPQSDFSLMATPASATVIRGGRTSYAVTVTALNGFSGTVTLSQTGRPAASDTDFLPVTIVGGGTSTMMLYVGANVVPGTYTITIRGTSGAIVRTTSVNVTVQ